MKPYIFTLAVVLLYVPLVFMGANVFFPKDHYYAYEQPCYKPVPVEPTQEDLQEQNTCFQEQEKKRIAYEAEMRVYEGWKFFFIVLFNLLVLIIALRLTTEPSIMLGLFLGSIVATCIATVTYFSTKSKAGFLILVIIFFTALYFMHKKKDALTFKS